MKSRIRQIIFFVLGLGLCLFPLISGIVEKGRQKDIVKTYKDDVGKEADVEKILRDAEDYNNILNQTQGAVVGNLTDTVLSDESYNRHLNIGENGIMGAIEIPKINVNLPIWHVTEEVSLSNGAGHLQGSSFPVGGKSTRSVLTSHRGLPSSKLFTRLDELKKGDLFYIQVCGKTLAYQVSNIEVIEPEEIDRLRIISGKDIVTLVTCTPYGINTHRLVVDGERVAYKKAVYDDIKPEMLSVREMFFFLLPFVFIAMGIFKMRKREKRRCKRYGKRETIHTLYYDMHSDGVSCGRKRTGRRKR